ncbi:DUF397 domain-containing protein [Lentzea sp. NPDC054927]
MAAERGKWFRSSYSDGGPPNCVECLFAAQGGHGVYVRDLKDVRGPVIHLSSSAWASFVLLACTL